MRETGPFGNRSDIGCFTDDNPETAQPTSVWLADASEFVIETTDGAGVRVEINIRRINRTPDHPSRP
jgi:hypothetical protein